MLNYSAISDLDVFFFYDENELQIENESDLVAGLIQPRRSLFFNRQDSSGVSAKENYPNSLNLNIGLKYDIVNWIAFRNTTVSDGSDNSIDRRIAVSQNSISFSNEKGNLDVNIIYIPFGNFTKPEEMAFPISRGV